MSKLYICEKPSLAKVLADNLGTPVKKDGYYVVGNDWVAWLKGHIVELLMPDDYKEEWQRSKCSYDKLPMIPEKFKKQVKSGSDYYKLFSGLKTLAKQADIIVNVGDPDREGQYLVDEVLELIGWTGKTERLFINAYDDDTVQKALKNIEDNRSDKNFNMFRSAFCRDITDWLIGMNGSRKFSLDAGYNVVVGRVQVPILALVYRRNKEIENFKPVTFYKVIGNHEKNNLPFDSEWKPQDKEKETASEAFDLQGRLLDKKIAQSVADKVKGKIGKVVEVVKAHKKVPQPLLYNLATLQKDACAKLGISLKELDEAMQSLYEKHKLLSYPRSDCEYLPVSQFKDAPKILSMLQNIDAEIKDAAGNADPSIRSRVFNDSKTTAHHAIIPTGLKPDFSVMTDTEKGVYLIVALRYILQFYPMFEYDSTKLVIDVCEEIFEAVGSVVTVRGWKGVNKSEEKKSSEVAEISLPDFSEGDPVLFNDIKITEGVTKPPERFTQESLITALCNAHKYVKEERLKEVIKNVKGLGTPATRSAIIGKLLERGTLIEKPAAGAKGKKAKKELYIAPEVPELIDALPDALTYPDQTAIIELNLDAVASGTLSEEKYIEQISSYINQLMLIKGNFKMKVGSAAHPVCPACGQGVLWQHKSEFGTFWSCSRYKDGCKAKFADDKGKPLIITCPTCGKGYLKRVKSKKTGKIFWSCSLYSTGECKAIFPDNNGKPLKSASPVKCPVCGKNMRQVKTQKGLFWVCEDSKNGCKAPWFVDVKGKPQIIKCSNCKKGFLIRRSGSKGDFFSCSNYPECKTSFDVGIDGKPAVIKRKKI